MPNGKISLDVETCWNYKVPRGFLAPQQTHTCRNPSSNLSKSTQRHSLILTAEGSQILQPSGSCNIKDQRVAFLHYHSQYFFVPYTTSITSIWGGSWLSPFEGEEVITSLAFQHRWLYHQICLLDDSQFLFMDFLDSIWMTYDIFHGLIYWMTHDYKWMIQYHLRYLFHGFQK